MKWRKLSFDDMKKALEENGYEVAMFNTDEDVKGYDLGVLRADDDVENRLSQMQ